MKIRSLTEGSISGTGTLTIEQHVLAAVAISTDGTNAGTVVIRKDNALGEVLYKISGKEAMHVNLGIPVLNTDVIYYSISGTGCTAKIFEEG